MIVDFPRKLQPLFTPSRFKSIRGGRDGGKSWGVARAMLEIGASRKLFVVCARETMESIKDSVHRLLCDQIAALGLEGQYGIEKSLIWHKTTGTEFVFRGLKNPDALKSLEGADIAWIEEAQSVSDESWRKLVPTVRRPGSEIWLTWNPELESDPTWKRFVMHPPPGMIEIIMNFSDNPWASEVLRDEREQMEAEDPDEYAHVWLGQPRRLTKGSVYGNEMRLCEEQGRIQKVEYVPGVPVDCGFDLGDGDFTAIWFMQRIMGQYRAIGYEEDRHKPLSHYLSLLDGKGYKYGRIYFPWDAASKIVVGSLEQSMRQRGYNVQVLPRQSRDAGIDAVREMLGTTWFDTEHTELGVQRLRYYRYGETNLIDQITGNRTATREPIHDDNSHGCLTGDSVVDTEFGPRSISEIAIGDRVWTPCGLSDVTASGVTHMTTELITVALSNGLKLRCTASHKIFTNKGLKRADALRYSDRVLGGEEWNSTLSSWISTAIGFGFREAITGRIAGHNRAQAICTALSGKSPMDRFQKAWKSIISTATLSTTNCLTSLSWMPESISGWKACESIGKALYAHRDGLQESAPQNGMHLKMGSIGTVSTAKKPGRIVQLARRFAENVALSLIRIFLLAPNGAPYVANLSVDHCSATPVYDLTVKSQSCYRANGMMVSNSDALRTYAMGIKLASVLPKPTPPPDQARRTPPPKWRGAYAPFG